MSISIFSEGKEYISASRAAEKIGYASDYIGQLCRAKKIPGRLIGRTWYVDYAVLLEHKKNRGSAKGKKQISYQQKGQTLGIQKGLTFEKLEKSAEISLLKPFNNVVFTYENDDRPRLPELVKGGKPTRSVFTKKLLLEFSAAALLLVVAVGASLSALEHANPRMSRALSEWSTESVKDTQLAAASVSGGIVGVMEFFLNGFERLKKIALGGIQEKPLDGSAASIDERLTAEEPVTEEPIRAAQTNTAPPPLDLETLRADLKSELESYVDTRLTTNNLRPTTVYNTYSPVLNTTVLREEILLADTRPTVTRQSTSDVGSFSSAISKLTSGGSFANPTITGASITSSSGEFTTLGTDIFHFSVATGTSATTTNFFSTNASTTNFWANSATIGSLTINSSSFTNFLVNGSSTLQNFSAQTGTLANLLVNGSTTLQNFTASNSTTTNATSSTFSIIGNGAGLLFTGTGNHDITATAGTLRIGANTIIGNILALDDTVDIGTAGTRFDKIYANEVNATTLVGTISGGNVSAETLSINSDNATADTEDGILAFERGSVSPNALLTWDSTNDRFTFNSDVAINSGIGSGSLYVNSSTTLQNFTASNSTSTSATTTSLYVSGLASTTDFRANTATIGNLTLGFSTLANILASGSTTLQNFTFTNATGTAATSTSLYISGLASTTNLRANSSIFGDFVSGLGTLTNLLINGSSTLQNFTFQNATGTNATTTNLFVSNLASTTDLRVANTAHFGGNVGIGTTGPGTKLEVAGETRLKYDSAVPSTILSHEDLSNNVLWAMKRGGTGSNSLIIRSYNEIGFAPNNADTILVNIQANGNVGIGTTSPQWKTQISGTAAPQLTLSDSGLATSNHFSFRNSNGIFYIATSSATSFATSTTPSLTIDGTTGYVGIGTVSPSSKLHIDGTAAAVGAGNQILTIRGTGTNDELDIGINSTSRNAWIRSRRSGSTENDLSLQPSGGKVGIGDGGSPGMTLSVFEETALSTTKTNIAHFTTGGSSLTSAGIKVWANNTGAYINADWRATSKDLDLILGGVDDSTFRDNLTLKSNNDSTFSGNVGIGTTTPQWKTQISGTAAPQLTLSDSGLATSNHFSFRNSNGIFYIATSSPTSFATSTTPLLTIDGTTGNVSIAKLNRTVVVDGVTYAKTCAGINAAIDALGAAGGEVVLPEGTYTCAEVVTIDVDYTTIRGSGHSTVINSSGTNLARVIDLNGKDFITLRDFKVIGKAGGTGSPGDGIGNSINTTEYAVIDNVWVHQADGVGIHLSRPTGSKIVNSRVSSSDSHGIHLDDGPSQNNIVANNTLHNNGGNGVRFNTTTGSITGNTVYSNSDSGIFVGTSGTNGGITVAGNTSSFNTNTGIDLNGGCDKFCTVTGNTTEGNISYGISLGSNTGEGMTISGNTIKNEGTTGIYLNRGRNVSITGNTITDDGTGTQGIRFFADGNVRMTGNSIVGNVINGYTGASARAIELDGLDATDNAIADTLISDNNIFNNTTGIVLDAFSIDITILDNVVASTTTYISDSSSVRTNLVSATSTRIGFGTTTPLSQLDIFKVSGDASQGFTASSTAGAHLAWTIGTDLSDSGKFKISSSTLLGLNDRFVIDGNGNVGIGETAPGSKLSVSGGATIGASYDTTAAPSDGLLVQGNIFNKHTATVAQRVSTTGWTPSFQTNDSNNGGIAMTQWHTTDAQSANLWLSKSHNATVGTHGAVVADENLGEIFFSGSDGTNFVNAASILAEVDGTPGTDDMPGRLIFSTTADGAAVVSERMRIDKSGNVGIGSTSPTYLLSLTKDSLYHTYFNISSNAATTTWGSASSNSSFVHNLLTDDLIIANNRVGSGSDIVFRTREVDRLTITDSGNVGIGTTTPNSILHVVDSSSSLNSLRLGQMSISTGDSIIRLTDNNDARYAIYANAANNSLRINSYTARGSEATFSSGGIAVEELTGDIGIGTTAPGQMLTVTGSVAFQGLGTGSGSGSICYASPTGLLSTSTTGCTGSSQRYKENVADMGYGLDELMALRPVTFDYKAEMYIPGHQVGFIAEEMNLVIPEVVGFDKDGLVSNIDYGKLTSVIVKAIQDLYAEFTELKETVLAMAERLVSREIVATERLCIGSTCIDEAQLVALLNQSGQPTTNPSTSSGQDNQQPTTEGEAQSTETESTNSTQSTETENTSEETATSTPETSTSDAPAEPEVGTPTESVEAEATSEPEPVSEPVAETQPEPAPEPAPESSATE
jgi:parallel beta-helix repeat protein